MWIVIADTTRAHGRDRHDNLVVSGVVMVVSGDRRSRRRGRSRRRRRRNGNSSSIERRVQSLLLTAGVPAHVTGARD